MSIFYVIATISGLLTALIAVDDLRGSFEKPEVRKSIEEDQEQVTS